MEKKEYSEKFASFGLWSLVEDISDNGDGELQLTADGELFVSEIEQELDKAREEGKKDLANEIATEVACGRVSEEEQWKTLNRVLNIVCKLQDSSYED